jgi:hypothetical protein
MQDIIDTLRANGLTKIPTIHNDKRAAGQFSQPGLGKVDLYGWDGYRKQDLRWMAATDTAHSPGLRL